MIFDHPYNAEYLRLTARPGAWVAVYRSSRSGARNRDCTITLCALVDWRGRTGLNGGMAGEAEPPRVWAVAGSYFEACNCEAVCPCHRTSHYGWSRSAGPSSFPAYRTAGLCAVITSLSRCRSLGRSCYGPAGRSARPYFYASALWSRAYLFAADRVERYGHAWRSRPCSHRVLAKLKRPVAAQFAGAVAGCLRGSISEELLQVVAGNESAAADFDVGEVAVAHLVVQQVAGQAG